MTNFLQLAFYKARPNGHLFDHLIEFWTGCIYSHVELYFPGDDVCWSSSPRDGGVRFKQIELLTVNWDLVDVPCTLVEALKIYDWCYAQRGRRYDWAGILGFGVPKFLNFQNGERLFCSEGCTQALATQLPAWRGRDPFENSPCRMYQIAQENLRNFYRAQ